MSAKCVAKGCTFSASDASGGLLCSACVPADSEVSLAALLLLKGSAVCIYRRRWALDLVSGDGCELLQRVVAAQQAKQVEPLVVVEPPPEASGGSGPAGALTLVCEAVSFGGAAPSYQWYKDGVALPRAERSRFMLCCSGPKDEGVYFCEARNEGGTVRSQSTEVRQNNARATGLERFESLLRLAADTEAAGDQGGAERYINEALAAAIALSDERMRAAAHCRRAELLLRLDRPTDAKREAVEAVNFCPGLAGAHAARGAAAAKLGLLAEAVCAWETAELLGGVPAAAAEAEACRSRLDAFFDEKAKERPEREAGPRDESGEADGSDDDDRGAAGQSWRQNRQQWQWQGQAGSSCGNAGSAGSRRAGSTRLAPALPPELHRQFVALGLMEAGTASVVPSGGLPTAEDVRRAYRKLALERHPDKGGSKAQFQELQSAYEGVLSALGHS